MEPSTIIFLIILAIFVVAVIVFFNKLVRALNLNREAFYNVDIALKKRFDLVPNLEATVKAYETHEGKTLTQITEIREKLQNNLSVSQRQKTEDKLSEIIKNVFVTVENYPEIKAGENFMALQKGLEEVEKDIEEARKKYNEQTRNYNILVESFPTNILAKIFSFKKSDYFEVDMITREENIKVDFNKKEEVVEEKQEETKKAEIKDENNQNGVVESKVENKEESAEENKQEEKKE